MRHKKLAYDHCIVQMFLKYINIYVFKKKLTTKRYQIAAGQVYEKTIESVAE